MPQKSMYARSVSSEGRDAQGRFYAYCIHPPKNAPFLASDEAVITFVESYPELTYQKTEREPDRDILIVKVRPDANMFRSHATPAERALRNMFLRDVASRALQLRDVPEYVQDACRKYMVQKGFGSVAWKPNNAKPSRSYFMFIDADGIHVPSWRIQLTPEQELSHLKRTCMPYLPFTLEAAPP